MAATKYTYSIQNDFPNHKVATDRLLSEIKLSAIVTAVDYINTSGDDCDIWFKDALSTGDEVILDGLVSVHSGEPLPDNATIVEVQRTPAKIINSSLKNGGSSNLAVNGSVTPVAFTYNPPSTKDILVADLCLIAETSNALSFGNKFIDTTIATLANGLLFEIKAQDEAYTWATLKRTRDIVELSKGDGLTLITGTPNLARFCLWLPGDLLLAKDGTFATADYLKITVRDDLRAITFMELFFQGVKL